MRSNYKKLGEYIVPRDEFNDGMQVKELLGIKNTKVFAKAKTNTIGINLEKYRIVRTGQFAFNRATTRNGDKISIALRMGGDCIVSPSYRVFEVKDQNELHPEYLMMWFRRPEFDRYARFKSHGSAHEFFGLEEMYEVELPIPPIEKQRAIVQEYNTIVNRIKLNEEINQKLEETAQAIYKHWFVDFEFPISKKYAEAIGRPELEGKPYKSSGGEMVYDEKLDNEIPVGWTSKSFTDAIDLKGGGTPKTSEPSYWEGEIPFFTARDINSTYYTFNTERTITSEGLDSCSSRLYPKDTTFVVARGATVGSVAIAGKKMAMNQSCYAILTKNNCPFFTHQFTINTIRTLKKEAIGATFGALVTEDFTGRWVIVPTANKMEAFEEKAASLYNSILANVKQNLELNHFSKLVLSRMAQKTGTLV